MSGNWVISRLGLPSVLHTWTFDEDLADWSNDLTSWHHKWRVERRQLCLAAKPDSDAKNRSPWSSTRKKLSDPSACVQARLWSSPIPFDVGIRCLSLSYSISGSVTEKSVDAIKSVQLSLLQHYDVWIYGSHFTLFRLSLYDANPVFQVFWLSLVHPYAKSMSREFVDQISLFPKENLCCQASYKTPWICWFMFSYLQHSQMFTRLSKISVVFLTSIVLSSHLELSKPLLTWAFSEDLEEWTNDGDNWLQKWRVSQIGNQKLLCLHTITSPRSRQSILLFEQDSSAKTSIQARLLSPLIPARLSLRCLSIAYSFGFDSGIEPPMSTSLSLLQRQKGCLFLCEFYTFCIVCVPWFRVNQLKAYSLPSVHFSPVHFVTPVILFYSSAWSNHAEFFYWKLEC